LAILEQFNQQLTSFLQVFKKRNQIRVSHYLHPESILFLHATSRNEAILSLVNALEKQGKIPDKELFFQALLEREKIVSTGIGIGVAIPHAKLSCFHDFFIAIGVQKNKGLEWQSLDKTPVRLIFLIGGPENKQTEYLQILSRLTMAIKEEDLRKKLLHEDSIEEILSLFSAF
jgi:PTS system nitrogen regulatory IIA component